ncbi:YhcN/YlaJ family sporulation lipoprotein [Gracilibacillus timonensis]|uniref:YhcN/YlaJ family sporulation lipoprotein n=1 Tax=Gracilibacillus timonensis TaxID=1816696 RepID=UPI000826857E|nr:YhcN/YlaJ family sporulation lipoprotein [Gracilibacillus timonensis]
MKLVYTLIIAFVFTLIGCQNPDSPSAEAPETGEEVLILHSKNGGSSPSQAYLDDVKEISDYKAVQVDDQLFVAITANPIQQATERKLEKKIEKGLKKAVDSDKVKVTSDQKFMIELGKLEDKHLSKKEAKKEINKLIKLSEEQA